MTTQELVERLLADAQECAECGWMPEAANLRAAADRLSEMDAENKRLREALNETIIDLNVYSDIGIIRARTIERRAALEHQQQKETP